jgi:isoaspartyl peptidase/L-asparaginase-like protein (Ntn-hydrolase superfamily)
VRSALDGMARGTPVETVAASALAILERRLGAQAGLILVDPHGRIAVAHTTPCMPAASRTDSVGR